MTFLTFLPPGMSPGSSPGIAYTHTWIRQNCNWSDRSAWPAFQNLVSIVYRLGLPKPNYCFWSIGHFGCKDPVWHELVNKQQKIDSDI